jgi:hypothetical protein
MLVASITLQQREVAFLSIKLRKTKRQQKKNKDAQYTNEISTVGFPFFRDGDSIYYLFLPLHVYGSIGRPFHHRSKPRGT